MLRNLVTSLFREERVRTTEPKAKEARRLAERLITRARGGTLADRRLVARQIQDETVLRKVFDDLGPRFVDRPGGYTRIYKLGFRVGDAAPTAMLELLGAPAVKDKDHDEKKAKKGKAKAEKEAAAEAAEKKPRRKAKAKAKPKAESEGEEKKPARSKAKAKAKAKPKTKAKSKSEETKGEQKTRRGLFGRRKKSD
jgi:large subunit ribosomal protein L17